MRREYVIAIAVAATLAVAAAVYYLYFHRNRRRDRKHSQEGELLASYFGAVYPNAPASAWSAMSDDQLRSFYDGLYWYYLPLVRALGSDKRGPLAGPYADAWTQAFLADGTDCGQQAGDDFFCSVYTSSCVDGSEFTSYGQPYQAIQFLKPYGRRDGFPSDAYAEVVAFACESLGKYLLTAPDCTGDLPTVSCAADGSVTREVPATRAFHEDLPSMTSAPTKPTSATATSTPTSTVACGYDCGAGAACGWQYSDGRGWMRWLFAQGRGQGQAWVDSLLYDVHPEYDGAQAPARPALPSFNSTMFYWQPGYGKFLDMGRTGIYFQEIHFLLTCPKHAPDGTPLRWTFPQIVQAATLGDVPEAVLKDQLEYMTNGEHTDEREYLEGYVTTLRGSSYEGQGGEEVPNRMRYAGRCENVGGLVNPMDDDFLLFVARTTVTKYYDPDDRTANPQYGKTMQYRPAEAVALVAGAHIYGATGADVYGPPVDGTLPTTYDRESFPHGTFFSGVNLDQCVFETVYRLGWDSVQMTMMPTALGKTVYCRYPSYDYELVYVGASKGNPSRSAICKDGFKLVDVTADWKNFSQDGYVDARKGDAALKTSAFDASRMALTERNVPTDCVTGDASAMPNAQHYEQPDTYIADTSNCPYRDGILRYAYETQGGINSATQGYA